MQIRTRLSFQFVLLLGVLTLLAFSAVYYFSAKNREEEFFQRLEEKARTTTQLFTEVDEIDSTLLRIIDRNDLTALRNENVKIYDINDVNIYTSDENNLLKVDTNLLREIRLNKVKYYYLNKLQVIGVDLNEGFSGNFIAIASAEDIYGYQKTNNLALVLSVVFILLLSVSFIAAQFFAKRALSPIHSILKQVDEITVNNLEIEVVAGNDNDEISQLAKAFNQSLQRLHEAFEAQKTFVSNASHELRTPLTTINGTIDVALLQAREPAVYAKTLVSVQEEVQELIKLSNNLLSLANITNNEQALQFESLRIDELIWETRSIVLLNNPTCKIDVHFGEGALESEQEFEVVGNKHWLKIVLLNVLENGAKYSTNQKISVELSKLKNTLNLVFKNQSAVLSHTELQAILKPFYRASNAHKQRGQGIGLSMVERIIRLHKGVLTVKHDGEVFSLQCQLPST